MDGALEYDDFFDDPPASGKHLVINIVAQLHNDYKCRGTYYL